MTTFNELYDECITKNPNQTQTINGVERQLSDDECCEACTKWAEMRLLQIENENAK